MHRTNALTSSDKSFEAHVMAGEEEAQVDETLQELEWADLQNVGIHRDPDHMKGSWAPTAAEWDMWEDYEMNGADFDIAVDPADIAEAAARHQFKRDTEEYGALWNAGEEFGDSPNDDGLGGDSEEDELLAEVM